MISFQHFTQEHQRLLIAAKEDFIHNGNRDPKGYKVEFDFHGKKQWNYLDVLEAAECEWIDFHLDIKPFQPHTEVNGVMNGALTETKKECEGVVYIKLKEQYFHIVGE